MLKKELFRAAVSDTLDLPGEIVQNLPRIIITGNDNLFLENHQGIVHYDDTRLVIKCSLGNLEICGENLSLPLLNPDALEVAGILISVSFTVI